MDSKPSEEWWIKTKASRLHTKVPGVRKLPFSAVAIIVFLILINVAVWIAVGIVLRFHKELISTAAISWVLGLRHALDADHIAAIDLMTRRLLASGQRPVTVGTFFSLGHSTIVIVTSIVVAATAAAVSEKFSNFSRIGGIIGSSVSATFLLLLGIMNIYILVKLIQQLRTLIRTPLGQEIPFQFEGGGVLFRILKRMFKIIDRPWKMYPLGVLFGLGFDTSSEIAILGISSIHAANGTSIWLILLFPLLFTAGMCMIDTIDGALMMSLYSSAALARDQIAICYYSITLTGVTVIVAVFIGIVQFLVLGGAVISEEEAKKKFWQGVEALGDRYDIVGGSICGLFLLVGILSVILYRPWRRRIDRHRASLLPSEPPQDHAGRSLDSTDCSLAGREMFSDTGPDVERASITDGGKQ
ncbi:nickel transport protein [Tothia fuscella]|uniref:Nickel/cobalt efflux system n=1 Tax=Tothia fuscella TaxID=1048955 RepID=A0A9P4U0B8_9PEZI|nr:nickel transport protein [Tothia fuscella]